MLHSASHSGHWPGDLSPLLKDALESAVNGQADMTHMIVKPVSRPRKQRFTARNYAPLPKPGRGYQLVGVTMKRHVRVNKALTLASGTVVRIGMLCEGQRAGRIVNGVVAAIHSDGRVGLDVLAEVTTQRVRWQRIVLSPRQHFRVMACQPILFITTNEVSMM